MEVNELIEACSDLAVYPHPVERVEVHHNHISVVFLAGPYAYKFKKPLRLDFLDYSTLNQRRHFCGEEVRLNRRLAPEIYLGVVPLARTPQGLRLEDQGEVLEWAVKMQRLPEEEAKGDTAEYVELTVHRIGAVFEGCRFARIDDLAPGHVLDYLAERRRLPKKEGGISIGTSNHYLRAVKGFSAWLAKDRRTGQDALKYLSVLNAETDRRHERRSVPAEEFRWLLATTRRSRRTFRGLSGYDRYMLYTVAGYTGLRCSELASLKPASFDLVGDPVLS